MCYFILLLLFRSYSCEWMDKPTFFSPDHFDSRRFDKEPLSFQNSGCHIEKMDSCLNCPNHSRWIGNTSNIIRWIILLFNLENIEEKKELNRGDKNDKARKNLAFVHLFMKQFKIKTVFACCLQCYSILVGPIIENYSSGRPILAGGTKLAQHHF